MYSLYLAICFDLRASNIRSHWQIIPSLLKAFHQVWKLKNRVSIFRKYRGCFPPPPHPNCPYRPWDLRGLRIPTSSQTRKFHPPRNSWCIRPAVILSGVKFAGFGSPSRILWSTGECLSPSPPPPAARSSCLFASMNYETMLLGFRLHSFPFFGLWNFRTPHNKRASKLHETAITGEVDCL